MIRKVTFDDIGSIEDTCNEHFKYKKEYGAMIIHLLMVHPSMVGKGIASSLVRYAMEAAKNHSCKVLRLDTGMDQ